MPHRACRRLGRIPGAEGSASASSATLGLRPGAVLQPACCKARAASVRACIRNDWWPTYLALEDVDHGVAACGRPEACSLYVLPESALCCSTSVPTRSPVRPKFGRNRARLGRSRAQIRPFPAFPLSSVVAFGPTLAEIGPTSAELGPSNWGTLWSSPGRTCSMLRQSWPMLAECRPAWAEFGPHLINLGPIWARSNQIWWIPGKGWSNLADFGPESKPTELGQSLADSGPKRPKRITGRVRVPGEPV